MKQIPFFRLLIVLLIVMMGIPCAACTPLKFNEINQFEIDMSLTFREITDGIVQETSFSAWVAGSALDHPTYGNSCLLRISLPESGRYICPSPEEAQEAEKTHFFQYCSPYYATDVTFRDQTRQISRVNLPSAPKKAISSFICRLRVPVIWSAPQIQKQIHKP